MTEYNIKAIKQQFKEQGIFYTPPELALKIKGLAKEKPKRVYDPTCGDGALLSVFDDEVEKYGQELDQRQIEVAKQRLTNFKCYAGDTLKDPAFQEVKFDCIVANPPFSLKWEPINDWRFADAPTIPTASRADYAFILHILAYLSHDGVAVVLNSPGILYRGQRERTLRKWLIDTNKIDKVVYIAGDTFVDTKIATVILVLRHDRTKETITLVDDSTGQTIEITRKRVADADYSLAQNSFFDMTPTKKEVDPIELEILARRDLLKKLNANLMMSEYASRIENMDFILFLDEIQEVIDSSRDRWLNDKTL